MRKGKTTFPHTDEEEGIIQTLHITLSALCSLHIAVLKGVPATRDAPLHGC
jgi:hypothetical protein